MDSISENQMKEVPVEVPADPTEELPEDPSILYKWSWGAAALEIIYGFGNKTWLTLLFVVPSLLMFVSTQFMFKLYHNGQMTIDDIKSFNTFSFWFMVVAHLALFIWFGLRGRRWAWKKKDYPAEHFEIVQKSWDRAGFAVFILFLIYLAIFGVTYLIFYFS